MRTPLIEKIIGTTEIHKILIEKILSEYENGQASGESIHITDSSNLPMILRPLGQVLQDTRNGYNILPITLESGIYNGLEVTVNEDKSVTLNGTVTAPLQLKFFEGNIILNGEYSYYLFNKTHQVNIQSTDTDIGIILRFNDSFEKVTKTYDTDTVLTNLFTYVDTTKNFNNETFKFMLIKGSEEKEYEAFGQMPSTIFPSPIKNVEGDYSCNIRNKNFISSNINDWEYGHYSIEGQKEPYTNRVRLKELVKVQPNTNYYVNAFSDKYSFVIREYNKNKNITNNIGGATNGGIFKTKENTEFLSIAIFNKSNMTESFPFSLFEELLENGTIKPFMCLNSETDKNYIESEQQIKALELPEGINLYNKNDGFVYLSKEQATELELDGEGWYVYNEWGEIVIVGTEKFIEIESVRTPKTYLYQFDYTKLMSTGNNILIGAKCNYFNEYTANNIWSTKTDLEGFSLNINHTLHIRTEIAPDLFKTWLEEKNTEGNPLKVVGKLVNPTYTKITDKNFIKQLEELQKVFSHEGTTNIDTCSTDDKEKAPLIISAEYLKSQKIINKNLETRITALEKALMNNI